jgi:hypothetical protein
MKPTYNSVGKVQIFIVTARDNSKKIQIAERRSRTDGKKTVRIHNEIGEGNVMKWITGRPVTPYRIYEVGEDEVRW